MKWIYVNSGRNWNKVFGKGNETFLSNQLVFILQLKFLICIVSFKKVNTNCFILSCTHLLIKISLKLENIFQLKNLTNFGHIEIPISGIRWLLKNIHLSPNHYENMKRGICKKSFKKGGKFWIHNNFHYMDVNECWH